MNFSFSPKLITYARMVWVTVLLPAIAVAIVYGVLQAVTLPFLLVGLPLTIGVALYVFARATAIAGESASYAVSNVDAVVAQTQLQHLFEQSPVPYLRIAPNGLVVAANLAAVRLFSTTVERITNIPVFEQLTMPDGDIDTLLGKLQSGVSIADHEVLITTFKDQQRWVRLSVHVPGTEAPEYLVTMVDITQQKRVDQAKSEFVALAAHQLRTPIAAIRWNIELLESTDMTALAEQQQNCLQKVSRNAVRMAMLIDDFLSVSKLETGTFESNPESVNFTEYLQEIIDEFAVMISKKQLQVQLSAPPTPLQIQTDMRLLHIVTSNLVSNACKYTPEGGSVTIAYEVANNTIVFAVTDTGIGVPMSEQTQLFTKFFRATNAQLHRSQGTGLGLYIVKQSAEMLGGDVSLRSTEGEGSTFTVRFPVRG